MKKYAIRYETSLTSGLNEINNYLHQRIYSIENDFSVIENCVVEVHDENGGSKNCEVAVWLTVPGHVYVARDRENSITKAAEVAFNELYKQLNGKIYG